MYLKTCNTEFDGIIITFADKNGRPLEGEDEVNLTLLINRHDIFFYRTRWGFLSFT